MKRRLLLVVAVPGIVALLLAACGGGDATATPVPPTATTRPTATVPAPAPTATPAPIATAVPATPTLVPTATAVPTATRPPATATPSGPQPKYGSTLKNRSASDWANWDSYDSRGAFSVSVFMNAFSNLIVFDLSDSSKLLPDLAERWEVSADGKTVTFFIRKGVKWHDGKDLTAADVVWNIQRAIKAEGTTVFNKSRVTVVSAVEAPDGSTVRLGLKQPSASFLPNMATPFMLMYSPLAPAPASAEFKGPQAVGSGPFKVTGYTPGVKYDFARNTNYYKKDQAGRQLPYLDAMTNFFLPIPAALAAFRTKQIDCGCIYDHDYLTANQDILEKDFPGLKLTIKNSAIYHMQFNQKPPWTNPLVRRGVYAALDRLLIRDLYRQGRGFYPPTVLLSPDLGGAWGLPTLDMLQVPGFRVKDGKKDPADVAQARAWFKEAGVDPASLNPVVNISQDTSDVGEVIQAALQTVGIKVDLRIKATAEATDALRQGQFDIALLQGGNAFDDPSDQPPRFLVSSGPENYGKWQRPEIDAVFQRMDAELDIAKRKQLAYEFQRKSLDEAVASPFQYVVSTAGTHRHVFGFARGPFTTHSGQRYDTVWIDETLR